MEKAIEVKNLNKKYGDKTILKNVNITVKRGEIFGLLGANGAGKSTAIECILGTKKASFETNLVLGMNPITQRKELFENVGVQFQEENYPDNILVHELCEEINSLYKNTNDYKELLKKFKLESKMNNLISQLSGGEKQKLFIILALIPKPRIVFLDELTTGLDLKSRREVWKILLDLKNKGLTILLTSHFMDEVEILCDHISIIKEGEIVFNGTVKEAIQSCPFDNFEDSYLWYSGEVNENESI